MKKSILVISVFLFLLPVVQAQGGIESVIGALKSGNSTIMARYFDKYIDITLPEKSSNYSKSQAELIIKDFFSNNSVKGFEVKHKGENNNGQFCIGTLVTKNGNYRTTVYMRMKDDKQVVNQISFQSM